MNRSMNRSKDRSMGEAAIGDYSKRVFGFSMRKTGNLHDAQDLSQEILASLIDALDGSREIDDLNAFIYTICCHTWSKFLRRNKRHWVTSGSEFLEFVADSKRVDDEVILSLDMQRLQREVSHLSEQHRKIVVLFYFEGKSCEQIAQTLGLANGAVRWHLFDIRRRLKEGFGMTESLGVSPKKLGVGHDGRVSAEKGQAGLAEGNLLVQNIAIACYGNPLTIEELSRELGVAAAYLEYHIADLVYLDYLKVINKNRYQTNFFIIEPHHQLATGKYHYENIGPIAEAIVAGITARLQEIRALGFTGNTLDDDFLLWSLIPLYTGQLFWEAYQPMLERNNVNRPKRKDGSEHWVHAFMVTDGWFEQCGELPAVVEFVEKSAGGGIKGRVTDLGVRSFQLDTCAGTRAGIQWREFDGAELNSLYRIRQLIENGEEPNDNDTLEIARMVDLGYVRVADGRPELLIPFLNQEQYTGLGEIFGSIRASMGQGNPFEAYIEGYAKLMGQHIPDFISKEERYYVTHSIYPHYAVLFHLVDHGLLRYPTDDEVKRLATILWCE